MKRDLDDNETSVSIARTVGAYGAQSVHLMSTTTRHMYSLMMTPDDAVAIGHALIEYGVAANLETTENDGESNTIRPV